MTQPEPIPAGQDTSPDTEQQAPPPFPDADQYSLTKVINQVQLNDELNTALGATVLIAVKETDDTRDISDLNPATLYVSPSGQNQAKVYDVINAHVAYTAYSEPAADRQYADVVQKVVDDIGVELSAADIQTAVKALLLKMNTAQQQSLNQELPESSSS